MKYFTLVFEGDLRKFGGNPFKTETPFGVPIAASYGNVLREFDDLEARLDKVITEEILGQG